MKYSEALINNLPPGKIWQSTWVRELLEGCGKVFGRIEHAAITIFVHELVDNVQTYLDEWSSILDIQTPNSAKIRGKLGSSAGQNIEDYREIIERVSDSDIQISFLVPAYSGMSCGNYLAGIQWKFTIILTDVPPNEFDTIRDILEKIQHAHLSILYFNGEFDQWTPYS